MPARRQQRITVSEHEPIPLPGGAERRLIRERLLRLNARMPFDIVSLDRKGLRAAAAVGLIDVGPVQIEVLPKAVGTGGIKDGGALLLDLLHTAGLVSS